MIVPAAPVDDVAPGVVPLGAARGVRRSLPAALLGLALLAWPVHAVRAQPTVPGAAKAASTEAEESLAPDSPRASLIQYLSLCREGRYDEAAAFLDLLPGDAAHGAQLARRLKAVLDRWIWFDLELVSPRPEGTIDDGLPPDLEEVGRVPGPTGGDEPVRLQRREGAKGADWVFSQPTVGRIDAWFGRLDNGWLIEWVPPTLLKPGPLELLWWQWLALPLLLIVALPAGRLLGGLTRALLGRLASRTRATWDDAVMARLGGPLTLMWAAVVLYLLVDRLGLYQPAEDAIARGLDTALVVVLFWSLLRSFDVVGDVLGTSAWALEHPASRSLVPLGLRVVKVLVVAIGLISVLAVLGMPVVSLLTGLGIGGLAVALAFQKTGENLFAAFSIGVDQPFRVGDFVRVGEITGTVELIGLRSTRIRTMDRTLVTLPNSHVAESVVESMAARDRIRFQTVLGLEYGTTEQQMRAVLAGLRETIAAHPKIWPDNIVVRFVAYADFSLNIEVMAWFQTTDFNEFRACREELLLAFMGVVQRNGTSFAFPTRTLHVFQHGAPTPPAGASTA